MAVDDLDSIDIVSTVPATGEVVLTISDHLRWDDENEHLLILQKKINCYLAFIESGQLVEDYPNADPNTPIRIKVVCKYEPSADGGRFLKMVRDKIEVSGWKFSWECRP